MVHLVPLGGQPVLIVRAVLMVTVVLSRIHLRCAAIMRCGLAAVPARRHLPEEVIKQVRHFLDFDVECTRIGENGGYCIGRVLTDQVHFVSVRSCVTV